jgi:hypothetical protein
VLKESFLLEARWYHPKRVLAAKRNDFLIGDNMEKDGKIWPTELDRHERSTRIHVAISQPEGQPYSVYAGTVSCVVVESEEQVEARLERNFPLYRLAQYGRRLLGLAGGGDEI